MAKLIKQCKNRQDDGRCKTQGCYCSFSPDQELGVCANAPTEKSKGKKK